MTQLLHRRAFLAASLWAPALQFPSAARQRIAVSTYPFRDVIRAADKPGGKLTLQRFAATLVEKFNVYAIEPWSRHFESLDPAYVADLAATFKNAGLRIVNIPCDVPVKLCGTPSERETALATYRKWVDVAVVLESPSIRVHCPAAQDPADISCALEGLKTLVEYGAAKNIVINIENDDPRTEAPERIVKVIEAANSPYLRSLPDFCNSMLIRDDQDYNAHSLAALFPLAYNISHVKDLEFSNAHKPLRVEVGRIFAIAKHAAYRGYFSIESESDRDPYESTKLLIQASLENLGRR